MKRVFYSIARIVVVASIAVFVTGSARADSVGESRTFHVSSKYDAQGASFVTATARAVNQHGYFYVDDRYWVTLSNQQQSQFDAQLDQLVTEFDTAIYPRSTEIWGTERIPGIGGDSHVTILFEQIISGAGGYYQTVNEYTTAQAPESNMREMMYINISSVMNGNAKNYIAHEFQHLISFNQKEIQKGVSDDVWLNEARSEYNITVAGYSDPFRGSTLERRASTFMDEPSDSLVEWPNTSNDYAITAVFFHYLIDRFGASLASSTIHSFTNGVSAINEWFSERSVPERFPQVFTDWMVASSVNDASLGAQYGYVRPGLANIRIPPQQSAVIDTNSESVITTTLKDWQPLWVHYSISSLVTQPAVVLTVTGQTGPWWGGAYMATYQNGQRRVVPFSADSSGRATLNIATRENNSPLALLLLTLTQGTSGAVGENLVPALPVTIRASIGEAAATPIPPPPPPVIAPIIQLNDGDLIRRPGQNEVYVIWGKYRRYLPQGVLELYGFQNRPVVAVADDVFNRYTTSNYVRALDGKKVYALWPDLTKHWLNITAAQFDETGRDWGAIFVINDAELAFYSTGPDITR